MKTNKWLSALSIFVTLTLVLGSVGHYTARPVQAGCECRFKTDISNIDNTAEQGEYVAIDDDGRSCEEIFNKANGDTCDPYQATLDVGWQIPTFSQLLGNVIRLLFFIAGLVTLVFLLLGGFEWVQSGGDEKKVEAARKKITSSVIGLVVMIAVLSLVIFLEQVVFGGKICLGISCPMNINFLKLVR